jgi:hypothetical protein
MAGNAEIASTPLRTLLHALYEVARKVMAGCLSGKRESLKPTKTCRPDREASTARVLIGATR